MLLSLCIPAYNRARYLNSLLDSILKQNFTDYEILICEDDSPERLQIAGIVKQYQSKYPGLIRFEQNETNLGYDANIRRLIERASGEYCLFMGNDDLLCNGALSIIADILNRNADCGVVIRSYATFQGSPDKQREVYRYVPTETKFQAGCDAVVAAYRRSVVIPGMVIHRQSALSISTKKFDGTLLYQLYLVGRIAALRSTIFTPAIIALRREGTTPDFGNSDSEKGKFLPGRQTPESSLHFMTGMLNIARVLQSETGHAVYKGILRDIGAYSYPILAIQAQQQTTDFLRYAIALGNMGLWLSPWFHVYLAGLLFLGPRNAGRVISSVKRRLGYTPQLVSFPSRRT
jgi:glycosyltransferase involved in cell wall biosynthesis